MPNIKSPANTPKNPAANQSSYPSFFITRAPITVRAIYIHPDIVKAFPIGLVSALLLLLELVNIQKIEKMNF